MKVALFGTQTEVIHIFISVNKLAGMGIDPKQLAGLLQSQNQIINTGEISAGEQQLRIVANGTYTTVDDIRNQVITTSGGQVKLGDIAIIEKGAGLPDPPAVVAGRATRRQADQSHVGRHHLRRQSPAAAVPHRHPDPGIHKSSDLYKSM